MAEQIRVLAAVVTRDDNYLIARRPAHKRHGGLWEFPGGKLEAGESLLHTAKRELREELDVEVLGVEDALFVSADEGSAFVIEFVPTAIEGEPKCHEHEELRWVPLQQLAEIDFAPSDRRFVEFLIRR